MSIQKDRAEQIVENAFGIAKKIADLGSIDAVNDSGAFDELMGFIDRGEIQLDSNDGKHRSRSSAPARNTNGAATYATN